MIAAIVMQVQEDFEHTDLLSQRNTNNQELVEGRGAGILSTKKQEKRLIFCSSSPLFKPEETMWKAAVAVLLLINMEIGVKGTVDETVGSVADRRKDTADAAQTGNTPASPSGSSVFLGKLLAVPMDGSHWVGMKAIIQEMGRRGHQVTVVIPEVSMRMGPGKYYDTLTYPVPYDRAAIDSMQSSIKDVMRKSAQSFVEKMKQRYAHFQRIRNLIHANAESLLFNSSLISHLAQQVSSHPCLDDVEPSICRLYCNSDTNVLLLSSPLLFTLKGFDAVLTDPIVPTGSLIARKLGRCTWIMNASGFAQISQQLFLNNVQVFLRLIC